MFVKKSLVVFAFCFSFNSVSGAIQKVGSNIILNVTDYYTVVSVNNSDALDILTSTDIKSWTFQRAVFDSQSVPLWSNSSTLQNPDINVIGTNGVRIYFAAKDITSGHYAISVAFSDEIESDRYFSTVNRPLVQNSKYDLISPSFVVATLKQYLVYVSPAEKKVYSVLLSTDGLVVESTPEVMLETSLDWEEDEITHAWIVSADEMYYIFYTACYDSLVGVARSKNPDGPFLKREKPLGNIASLDLTDIKKRLMFVEAVEWPLFIN